MIMREGLAEGIKFSSGLENAVSTVWPENNMVNSHALKGPDINALVTFCPLYAPGALKDSQLLGYPRSN